MANVITGNVWRLDTPSASTIWPDAVYINEIRWENYAGVPDTAVLTDVAGRTIFSGHAVVSLEPIATSFGQKQRVFGLVMPTLASGTIYVSIV